MDAETIIRQLMEVIDEQDCCNDLWADFTGQSSNKKKPYQPAKKARKAMNEAKAYLSTLPPH